MAIFFSLATAFVAVLFFIIADNTLKKVVSLRHYIKPAYRVIAMTISLVAFAVVSYFTTVWQGYILNFIILFIYLKVVYSGTLLATLAASCYCYFVLVAPHILVINIFAISTYSASMSILADPILYPAASICAILLSLLITIIIRFLFQSDNYKALISSKPQLMQYAIIQTVINLACVALCYSYYVEISNVWFYAYNLLTIAFLTFISIMQGLFNIKASKYYSIELKNAIFEEQLSRQLMHYESYKSYTESLQAFKHDYNRMMTSVQTLLAEEKYTEAKRLIDRIDERMQTQVKLHKRYCNNTILDAILYDISNKCNSLGIAFTCTLFLPPDLALPELETCTIFSNILDNAIEATQKLTDNNRFISISSNKKSNWCNFVVTNSFDGNLVERDSNIFTSKSESELHGFGLKNVCSAAEKVGGFVEILPDGEKKVFTIVIHIPTCSKDDV